MFFWFSFNSYISFFDCFAFVVLFFLLFDDHSTLLLFFFFLYIILLSSFISRPAFVRSWLLSGVECFCFLSFPSYHISVIRGKKKLISLVDWFLFVCFFSSPLLFIFIYIYIYLLFLSWSYFPFNWFYDDNLSTCLVWSYPHLTMFCVCLSVWLSISRLNICVILERGCGWGSRSVDVVSSKTILTSLETLLCALLTRTTISDLRIAIKL